MQLPRRAMRVTAAGLGLLLTAVLAPATASAGGHHGQTGHTLGTRSLATVLAADGDTFDRNWSDYDVLTQAVGAVLAAKPNSPVAVLADGSVPLTAFLPNDRAFQLLAADLTGKWYRSESQLFAALATGLGVDTIESVLLYHVIPGATIDSKTALRSDGARLTTALSGKSIKVDVLSKRYKLVRLIDADRNDLDPLLDPRALDVNKGNRQIAHGILLVLRPADL
jgi:hypothetical protein